LEELPIGAGLREDHGQRSTVAHAPGGIVNFRLLEATLPDVLEDPIGYSEPAMDEEMSFPNPVVRTDLPTRKRRWPRVLMGLAAMGVLTIVFLPQILSSKVGRKFVVSYISSKTNSPVTLESFKTSWFGGTTVNFLTIYDPMNRHMGFKSFTCKAGLFNLLRGKYKLGDTVIEGLNVDYMVDDGRGASSWDLLKGPPGEGGGFFSNLSGKIQINSGTVTLFRGTVQPKYFNTTWQQAKIDNFEATFDVQSLDKWSYTFSADPRDESGTGGTITSSGSIDGGNGIDLTVAGENIRVGPLGAAILAGTTPEDIRQTLGAALTKVDIAIKTLAGKMKFEKCDITGSAAAIHAQAAIDQTASPAVLEMEGAGSTISLGVSNRLASQGLVYFNPFFREAVSGSGKVELVIEKLSVPLNKQWNKTMSATGSIKAKGLSLNRRDEMGSGVTLPDNLASQLALLTGDSEKNVPFDVDGPFSIADGSLKVSGMRTVVGDTTSMIEGAIDLDSGAISMIANLASAPRITSHFQGKDLGARIGIAIGGTILHSQMDVLNLKGELTEASVASLNEEINQQITRMRAKESLRMMQKSQNEVEEILRPLRGPATLPAGGGKK